MIPTSFKLMNRLFRVLEMDEAVHDAGNMDGQFHMQKGTIELYVGDAPVEYTQHTFYHELAHSILESAGREDLSGDEAFVDLLGGLLHQFMQTKRGDFMTD